MDVYSHVWLCMAVYIHACLAVYSMYIVSYVYAYIG